MYPFADPLRRGPHVPVNIATRNIHKHEPDQLSVLVPNRWRPCAVPDFRQHRNRHLRARWRGHEHPLQGIEVLPKIARIPDADRVTFASFDDGGDSLAAYGALDDLVDGAHRQPVTGRRLAVDCKIEKIPSRGSLGKGAAGVGQITQRLLD